VPGALGALPRPSLERIPGLSVIDHPAGGKYEPNKC